MKPLRQQDDSSRISAYFDGACNREEAAEVHRAVKTSAASRKELAEIKQLSALIGDVPRERAGDEFVHSVMQRAERAVLIPGTTSAAGRDVGARVWAIAIVSSVATAAALLLMIQSPNHSSELASRDGRSRAGTLTQPDERNAYADVAFPGALSSNAAPDPVGVASTPGAEGGPIEALNEGAAGRELRGAATRAPASLRSQTVAPMSQAAGHSGLSQQQLLSLKIGDVVPYLREGDVAVIQVTVLDIKEAPGVIRLLLTKNAIEPEKGGGEKDTTAGPGDVFAVLVETTDDRLEETIAAMEMNSKIVDMRLRPPVQMSKDGDTAAIAAAALSGAPSPAANLDAAPSQPTQGAGSTSYEVVRTRVDGTDRAQATPESIRATSPVRVMFLLQPPAEADDE